MFVNRRINSDVVRADCMRVRLVSPFYLQLYMLIVQLHFEFNSRLRHHYFALIYATADEADAYMFYRFFLFFFVFCLLFFRSPQKYQTTVLGNG